MSDRILPFFAFVLSIAIFFVYVRPLWTGPIAETRAAIADKNEALAVAELYRKEEDRLTAARADIERQKLDQLSIFLPDSVDNVQTILDINALALRSKLSLTEIDIAVHDPAAQVFVTEGISPTAQNNSVNAIDLSLTVVGAYDAFQNFLSKIEKGKRFLDVREITVKGSDTGVYSYKITLRLYWLR